jgi:hypothetical protein
LSLGSLGDLKKVLQDVYSVGTSQGIHPMSFRKRLKSLYFLAAKKPLVTSNAPPTAHIQEVFLGVLIYYILSSFITALTISK